MFYLKMHMNFVCVCTCICVHSLHGQNKELCSVLFCSVLYVVIAKRVMTSVIHLIHALQASFSRTEHHTEGDVKNLK